MFFESLTQLVDGTMDLFYGMLIDILKFLVVASISFMSFLIVMSWDIARDILSNLALTETINNYYNSLDSNVLYFLNVFRIVESVNLVINAYVTRFVLSLIPFTRF